MLYRTHAFFPTFVELIKQISVLEPIYDLGTSKRFAKELNLVREYLPKEAYFAGGFRPDNTVNEACDFHCDVQDLNAIGEATVGALICLDVLEHTQDPHTCLRELIRVLKPDGLCLISMPFMVGYHGTWTPTSVSVQNSHASYSDYWRFSHEGMRYALDKVGFTEIKVLPVDGPVTARLRTLQLEPILRAAPLLERFLTRWKPPTCGSYTTRHFALAKKPSIHATE